MKSAAKVLFFAAAALATAAAQAGLLTTWELPEDLEIRNRERAALSNEVEMLAARWTPAGNGLAILYRTSRGGATMAKVVDEAEVLAKVGLVKSPAIGSRETANAGSVVAWDDGWDDVYMEANTWLDCNGGRGFGAWTVYGETAASFSLDWVDGSPAGRVNEGDFTLHSEDGETTVRRDFATAVAGDGSFSARVWLSAMQGVFCGFSVYSGNGELFRWGIGRAETGERGLVYATNGSGLYELIEEGTPIADYIDYTLAWERVGDDLLFNLTGQSSTGYRYDDWLASPVLVENAGAVAGIAVIANSAAANNPAVLTFDRLEVRSAAVPEPGTLGLLAAGLAMLAARRKRG